MRKPSARCANGVGALLLALLAASPVFSGDILVITNDGVFVVPVNGSPGQSLTIEQWWQGDVVDQRGDKPPTEDKIADQVDAWADLESQDERDRVVVIWQSVVDDVRSKKITLDEARTEVIKQRMDAEVLTWPVGVTWIKWRESVDDLIRKSWQDGTFTLGTLQSIVKGLRRG